MAVDVTVGSLDDLGGVVHALRLERGLTQEELGEKAGVNAFWINELENGRVSIRLERVCACVDALGASLRVSIPDLDAPPTA